MQNTKSNISKELITVLGIGAVSGMIITILVIYGISISNKVDPIDIGPITIASLSYENNSQIPIIKDSLSLPYTAAEALEAGLEDPILCSFGRGKYFLAQVAFEGFFFFVAQSVFHQCCSRLKDLIALIVTMLFVHLFIRLRVCGMGEVVQFQCIAPFKSNPADLTQIFPLVAVHGVHVSVYMLHPLCLVLAEVALQVDCVYGLGSF